MVHERKRALASNPLASRSRRARELDFIKLAGEQKIHFSTSVRAPAFRLLPFRSLARSLFRPTPTPSPCASRRHLGRRASTERTRTGRSARNRRRRPVRTRPAASGRRAASALTMPARWGTRGCAPAAPKPSCHQRAVNNHLLRAPDASRAPQAPASARRGPAATGAAIGGRSTSGVRAWLTKR